MSVRLSGLKFLFFFSFITAATASPLNLFWTDQINSAIQERDSYFSAMGVISENSRRSIDDEQSKIRLSGLLDSSPAYNNPWFNLLKGISTLDTVAGLKEYSFNRALSIAQKDPGTTWVLFVEFIRYKQDVWAEKSIVQLERQLFESGARSSRIISSLLLNYGILAEKEKNTFKALKYYEWAKRFDPLDGAPYLRGILLYFPFSINGLKEELGGFLYTLRNSWTEQIELFSTGYNWLRCVVLFFILSVFITLIIKYFPFSLHNIADLFPTSVSLTLRTILASACVISLSSFGILPFLWVSAYLIWHFLNIKERVLLAVALIFLILAPVDTYLQSMFSEALNPESSVQMLSKAVNEGYSDAIYKEVIRRSSENPTDFLSPLSAAIYEVKRNDYSSARQNIQKSTALRQDDPVVLISAGNLSYLEGDLDKAKTYFKRVVEQDKGIVSARFNLAQCYLRKMETITGTEMLNDAAERDPIRVNSFVHKNDTYFSTNWPALRQVMFSDYPAIYFWTSIFPFYTGSWSDAGTLWGTQFLGLSPLVSIIVSIILFIFLFIIHSREASHSKVRRFFECKYCGRIICRKCKSGLLCNSCFEKTRFIRNENKLVKKQHTISNRFHLAAMIKKEILEIVFPGSGSMLDGQKPFFLVILFLLITSFVYASYAALLFNNHISSAKVLYFLLVILFAYNFLFLYSGGMKIVRFFREYFKMQKSA